MLRPFFVFSLLFATPVSAADINVDDIRPVEFVSTDVFEVLTTLKKAQLDFEDRDYLSARTGFEFALLHDPDLAPARTGLRRTLMALGEMTSALALLEEEVSNDGLIIRIHLGLVENPEQSLIQFLETDPDPRLWTLLGQLQDRALRHRSARQSYAMAGLSGARAGLAENNIGESHFQAKEYELALQAFAKANLADPTDPQFDNNRRRTLIALGKITEAIEGLRPETAALFLEQAADIASADKDVKFARYLYEKALDFTPRHLPRVEVKINKLME